MRRIETTFGHGDRVAVVTHGGLANLLLHAILRIPPATPQWFELHNASITHLRLAPDPPGASGLSPAARLRGGQC